MKISLKAALAFTLLLGMSCSPVNAKNKYGGDAPLPPDSTPQNMLEFLSPGLVGERVSRESRAFNTYIRTERYSYALVRATAEAASIIREANFEFPGEVVFQKQYPDHKVHKTINAYFCNDTILTWFQDEVLFGVRGREQAILLAGLRKYGTNSYAYSKVGDDELVRGDGNTISPDCAIEIPDGRAVYVNVVKPPTENTRFYERKEYEWRDSCPARHYGNQHWVRRHNYYVGTGEKVYLDDWQVDKNMCRPWKLRTNHKAVHYIDRRIIAGREIDWKCADYYKREGWYKGPKTDITWGAFERTSSTCDGVTTRPPLVLDEHDRKDKLLRTETQTYYKRKCPIPYAGRLEYQREVKYYRSTNPDGSVEENLPKYGKWTISILECSRPQTRNVGCPSGYTGSISQARTLFLTNLKGATTSPGWTTTSSSCRQLPVTKSCITGGKNDDSTRCWCYRGNSPVSCRLYRSSSGRDRDDPTHDADGDGVDRDIDRDDNDDRVGAGGRANDGGGGGGHSRDGNANDGGSRP